MPTRKLLIKFEAHTHTTAITGAQNNARDLLTAVRALTPTTAT